MDILETAIIISCLPILGVGLLGSRILRPLALLLLILPAALVAIHSLVGGLRSSMIPVYLVTAFLGLLGLIGAFSQNASMPPSFMKLGTLCILCLLAMGVFLAWWYPIFELPRPPGSYPIGSRIFELDRVGQEKQLMRALTVQIWYPATKDAEGKRMPYLSSGESWGFGFFSSFRMARTHAYTNARISKVMKKWPVIIYSPPWEGGTFQNTMLFESLASEGFIVVAVELPVTSATLPPLDFGTEESIRQFQIAAHHELEARTSDVLRVFSALRGLNAGTLDSGMFKSRLNLQEVGVMGYSFGGAVSAEALTREPRLRAGVNFDGALFGNAAQQGAKQPFLFVTDTDPTPSNRDLHSSDPAMRRNAEFYWQSLKQMNDWLDTHGGWLIQIQGAHHTTYCDISLYAYRGKFNEAKRKKATNILEKINSCTLAFFDQTLRGNSPPLMQKNFFPWPDVEIRKFNPRQVNTP
ncbi:MAG: dienelactone hydrolase family protein [Chthoniobacterales bacterium]